jgi:hypothetical protein
VKFKGKAPWFTLSFYLDMINALSFIPVLTKNPQAQQFDSNGNKHFIIH